MINIVVFGTGSCAERIFDLILDFDEINILAFADNDKGKHGKKFKGLQILSSEQLSRRSDVNYILIASQWYIQIIEGLQSLGITDDKMIPIEAVEGPVIIENIVKTYQDYYVYVGDEVVPRAKLPKVLILSFETLNDNHGTGVLLKRYFSDFPLSHLFSIAHRDCGTPWLEQSLLIRDSGENAVDMIRSTFISKSFTPDLIYATALHEQDLNLLQIVLAALPGKIPIIQHFMDFIPHDERLFTEKFNALKPWINQVWALTKNLKDLVQNRFKCESNLVSGLIQNVNTTGKKTHRKMCSDFRTVMIGNFYNPSVINFIKGFWSECKQRQKDLGAVEWYVAPRRLQEIWDAGFDPGLDFVWRGFFNNRRLQKRLVNADVALLPLNHTESADSNYLRFSLPSRISDFACLGLPVFAIASKDTPLHEFINETGVGRCVSGPDLNEVADSFIDFATDVDSRSKAGDSARRFAVKQLDIVPFKKWFNKQIVDLAESNLSVRCLSSRLQLLENIM